MLFLWGRRALEFELNDTTGPHCPFWDLTSVRGQKGSGHVTRISRCQPPLLPPPSSSPKCMRSLWATSSTGLSQCHPSRMCFCERILFDPLTIGRKNKRRTKILRVVQGGLWTSKYTSLSKKENTWQSRTEPKRDYGEYTSDISVPGHSVRTERGEKNLLCVSEWVCVPNLFYVCYKIFFVSESLFPVRSHEKCTASKSLLGS